MAREAIKSTKDEGRYVTRSCCSTLLAQSGLADDRAVDTAPQDVAFTASVDSTEQRYVQVLPPSFDAKKPVDVLIALHGHGSDRWQFIRLERDECRAAMWLANAGCC